MTYTHWLRDHVNGWTAWVDVVEDSGFHYGAHPSEESVSWTQHAEDLATAMSAADELVPEHDCFRCPAWSGSDTLPNHR